MTEEAKTQQYKFKAEVSQLLEILTHSLYTHRDVFIRELISNAADALDKVRFLEVKGEKVADPELPLEIRISLNKEAGIFAISDTGIGMTREELIKNIGTIARSGTAEFLKKIAGAGEEAVSLIGRFGVGFYAVFMAADRVEITTQSVREEEPTWVWISDGRGAFTITQADEKMKRGTQIRAILREDAREFADPDRVKAAIQKYSSFVPFPIYLENKQVNTIQAIWREPKTRITEAQYKEFFKFIAHEEEDPLTWIHVSADVPIQFHAILYVPKTNLELLGFGRQEDGLQLFVRRVLIDPHADEVLPNYLRFVRGVLESDDLPLNISRETLQENPHLTKIRSTLVKRFLTHLAEFAEKDPEGYQRLWKAHGRILKEGYNDFEHKDQLVPLFRFNSSKCRNQEELIDLNTYVSRMPEKLDTIVFLSGPSREALEANPLLDLFKAKDIEVLYCYDPIDEFVLPGLITFQGKRLLSADQVDPQKLEAIPFKEPTQKPDEEGLERRELEKLARRMKDILGKRVETVRLSDRLVENPAVLVSPSQALSGQMEKIMRLFREEAPPPSRILEINPKHPLIRDLYTIYQKDARDPLLTKLVEGLYTSVLLLDGLIDHPQAMAAHIQALVAETARRALDTSGSEKKQSPSEGLSE